MIKYTTGDATSPQATGFKFIIHISNDAGGWGAGFVLAISKKWKEPEALYRSTALSGLNLGAIQIASVEQDTIVVNMIAQHKWLTPESTEAPIRYDALRECLRSVSEYAGHFEASVHCPRIGAGLSGGDWDVIERIMNEELKDIDVTVYDLPNQPFVNKPFIVK